MQTKQRLDVPLTIKSVSDSGEFEGYGSVFGVVDTRVLRDPYTNKPYVGFYTTKRVGGMLVDSQAVKILTLSAA